MFKSKSGNEWKNKDNFEKCDGKYFMMKTSLALSRNLVERFDYLQENLNMSSIEDLNLFAMLDLFTNSKIISTQIKQYNINFDQLPLSHLKKERLLLARSILEKIEVLIKKANE